MSSEIVGNSIKAITKKKGQKILKVHRRIQCLFLQLVAKKKTQKRVHLEIFLALLTYHETALVAANYMRKYGICFANFISVN